MVGERMSDGLLATLIHISDLHFGCDFTADETVWKQGLALIPGAQGLFRHSYQAARALAQRVNQIIADRRAEGVPICVAFTGDLTRGGEEKEFLVGSTFLRSAFAFGAGNYVGLKLGNDRKTIQLGSEPALFAVPGNHDIWGRKDPRAVGAYRRHFPGDFPLGFEIQSELRPVILYGLDSTQNTDLRHRLARGRVPPEELEALETKLQEGLKRNAIQIVCLHHPLADPQHRIIDATMKLEDRELIARRLLQSGADLVLAGHIHEWFVADAESDKMPTLAVAGTATQQVSARSFFVTDVYKHSIKLFLFEFGIETRQFLASQLTWEFSLKPRLSQGAEA